MKQPLVITIILNTNRRDDTLACLASLQQTTYPHHRLIVLDNASSDGSVEAINHQFPAVQVIALEQNLGYAGNNNIGIEEALRQEADWVFVLNEDTIVSPDCLNCLIDTAGSHPQAGILGPIVYHFDEPNGIQSAGGKLTWNWTSIHLGQNEVDTGQFSAPRPVDWVSGCALLVNSQVIREIGALDPRFFYYWEETDLCKRASRKGWQVFFVPQAKIWHKGVQRAYTPSANVTYYNTRNRLLFMAKHHAPLQAWVYMFARTSLTLLSWSLNPKWRKQRQHRDAMWQGVLDFFRRRWGMQSA